ncbi:MAG: ATP synthase F1 subunit gamma [Flavobacteriaceae bacterium TMED184]|nr:MAG: ATP synthase F1 subunit gamma [Flavobacteriaceae bacterium TMED184]
MANLKEIRNRISSVSSTMQITSAMKMVSAAKLKKAQEAITSVKPYSEKLDELIALLSSGSAGIENNEFVRTNKSNKILIVSITSNRGLCGAFNSNIIKETIRLKQTDFKESEVEVLSIGKKGGDILSKSIKLKERHDDLFDDLNFENTESVADIIMKSYTEKGYDKIVLVYNRFKNAATQVVSVDNFLPVEKSSKNKEIKNFDTFFEPSETEILKSLIPKSLKVKFYKSLRDSFASEHGARMTAMHKATDNATELRDELKLTYNKARQASITNEILEIVGGAEALKN